MPAKTGGFVHPLERNGTNNNDNKDDQKPENMKFLMNEKCLGGVSAGVLQ